MSGINIIAIVAANGAIGKSGDQPFHISDDFRRFKALTLGHPVIMGRRTFDALPGGALPGRRNIVVTTQMDWHRDDVETAPSVKSAMVLACETDSQMFVIGGGEIYHQAMEFADRLYLTQVDAAVEDADVFFPEVDPQIWEMTACGEYATDPRSGVRYRFTEFSRR